MTLVINLNTDGNNLELQGFPFEDGQYIDYETPRDHDTLVGIALGDAEDTTTAQEQYLDTNPAVVNYNIIP